MAVVVVVVVGVGDILSPMKIVHVAELPENKLIIRYPVLSDAAAMCDYINTMSVEQTFIRFQGEQITLEDETKYLESLLQNITNKRSVHLLAFVDDELVSISGVELKDKTEGHQGLFGITVAKEYRGQGVGKLMMQTILTEAEKELSDLQIITLEVFGTNELAISMYEKFGFKEYGRLPQGIKLKAKLVDGVFMFRTV